VETGAYALGENDLAKSPFECHDVIESAQIHLCAIFAA